MRSYGKSIIAAALILVVALFAFGCATSSSGSYSATGYSHSMSNEGAHGTYSSFSGARSYSKELKAGDVIAVTLTTNSGTMAVTATAPDGTVLLNTSDAGEYTFTAEADGKYTVSFVSASHSGGYTIAW